MIDFLSRCMMMKYQAGRMAQAVIRRLVVNMMANFGAF